MVSANFNFDKDELYKKTLKGLEDNIFFKFDYTSINPFIPGTGWGVACTLDNGQGVNDPPDEAAIALFGGPFGGYSNWGEIQGNLDKKACKN